MVGCPTPLTGSGDLPVGNQNAEPTARRWRTFNCRLQNARKLSVKLNQEQEQDQQHYV